MENNNNVALIILIAVFLGLLYLTFSGTNLPILKDKRSTFFVLFLLGVFSLGPQMCGVGTNFTQLTNPNVNWYILYFILGGLIALSMVILSIFNLFDIPILMIKNDDHRLIALTALFLLEVAITVVHTYFSNTIMNS